MTIEDQPGRVRRGAKEGTKNNGAGAPGGAALPERLQAARESRGLDLFRVERDTKIRLKYLKAMEDGDFEQLPGEVYARGFLRNYASYLGLDADEAEAEWKRGGIVPRTPAKSADQSSAAKSGASKSQTRAEVTLPSIKLPSLKLPSFGRAPATSQAPVDEPSVADVAPTPVPATVKLASSGTDDLATIAVPAAALSDGPAPSAEGDGTVLHVSETESPPSAPRRISIPIPSFLRRRPRDEKAPEPFQGPAMPTPARAFRLQPAHFVILVLVVAIVGVSAYFANQAQKVLQDPVLSVSAPVQGYTELSTDTHTYRLEGNSTPNAEINISLDQRTSVQTQADAQGSWSKVVTLHSGVNQIDVYSVDLATNHKSDVVTRYLSVPAPTASPVPLYLSVDSPVNGSAFARGNITVTGTTVSVEYVTVTPTYMGPPVSNPSTARPSNGETPTPTDVPTLAPLETPTPFASSSATVTPRPTATPAGMPSAVQVIPTIDGKYSAQVQLYSGTWQLTVIGTGKTGLMTTPKTVTIVVLAGSLKVTILARAGSPALKIWKDGRPWGNYVSFEILPQGHFVTVVADRSVWIETGIPRYTWVTVNGVNYGQLSPSRTLATWLITAFSPPTPMNNR
jgi:hypothetical protein